MMPRLRLFLWPKEPHPAMRMTLEWPRLSKSAGEGNASVPPEMVGAVMRKLGTSSSSHCSRKAPWLSGRGPMRPGT
eukprot:5464107-Alexandrium_andersonii.AAC.1